MPTSWSSSSFKASIKLTDTEKSWVITGFFWAYALAQVPAGWLSDRFGTRGLVTLYIAIWSVATALTGYASGFLTLLLARMICGLAEAGYYPASSGMITRWAHTEWRGVASSVVSWGGRVGGAAAPFITVYVIAKFDNWRWAGWIYGFSGLLVAAGFYWIFRDHPLQHPRCNETERKLLAEGRGDFRPLPRTPRSFPWAAAWRSKNLWMANGVQFFTNVGWVFLIFYLQDYLTDVAHLPEKEAGMWKTIALSIGIASLLVGGGLTDWLSRRYGLRLGRMIPLSVTKFIAAGCYLLALWVDEPGLWPSLLVRLPSLETWVCLRCGPPCKTSVASIKLSSLAGPTCGGTSARA